MYFPKNFTLTPIILLLVLVLLDRLYPLNLNGKAADRDFASVVVDQAGRPLRAFADNHGIWRYAVVPEQVSPQYIEALLNYEDRHFWSHPGINPLSLLRAAYQNIRNGRIISGGSTLSMQVARLLHPHSRTIGGKLKQMMRTLQLEWHLSKRDILTLYLNIAPFGGTLEGVQAASYSYLDKAAADLSDAEAALLAVLPQAPTRYRPDIHPAAAQQARNKVLDRLAKLKVWSKTRVYDAKMEPVYAYRAQQRQSAPLFSLRMMLESKKQQARGLIPGADQGVIRTTIDGELQSALEDHLRSHIQRLPPGTSAAVLVVENDSAAVKAYLGSADFADNRRFGHVDMVRAIRSPGSTLKPFLYALALEQGLIHSQSLLADVPRSWGEYRPSNFNNGFSGPVSAAEALQRSLNVPFIDLLERYGAGRFVSRLEAAGVKLRIPGGRANLALILGGAGTSLEQLVTGYRALARGGKTAQLKMRADEPQQRQQPPGERYFFSPQSAWITYHTLSEIAAPGSLNTYAALKSRGNLAWKTGTSFGFRDSWAIGVSRQYTIGIWLGRPDGSALPGFSGATGAGPLLFVVSDHIQQQVLPPEQPAGVEQRQICWPLGLPPEALPGTFLESESESETSSHCHIRKQAWTIAGLLPPTWHGADATDWQSNPMPYWVNGKSGLLLNAGCEVAEKQQKQAALWPKVLTPWLPAARRRAGQLPPLDPACTGPSPASGRNLPITGLQSTGLQITGIVPDSIYRSAGNSTLSPDIGLRAIGGSGDYHWYINGQWRYSGSPERVIQHRLGQPGAQQILVVDDSGNIDKVNIRVE